MAKNTVVIEPFFSISGQMLGGCARPAGVAHPADPPAVGERGDAALERPPADRVDDEVDATTVGESHHLGGTSLVV